MTDQPLRNGKPRRDGHLGTIEQVQAHRPTHTLDCLQRAFCRSVGSLAVDRRPARRSSHNELARFIDHGNQRVLGVALANDLGNAKIPQECRQGARREGIFVSFELQGDGKDMLVHGIGGDERREERLVRIGLQETVICLNDGKAFMGNLPLVSVLSAASLDAGRAPGLVGQVGQVMGNTFLF